MERIAMSSKELVRYRVLGGVLEGQLALQEAAVALGVSPRHARRLLTDLREKGPQGLVHGNRGRPPANRTPDALRQQILSWVEDRYAGFNDTHLTEILAEREAIAIGRETLRGILRAAGHRPKRRRRPKRHHKRRERSATKGLMVLWDGSPHRWFGDEKPAVTLMAAIDEADGELLACRSSKQICHVDSAGQSAGPLTAGANGCCVPDAIGGRVLRRRTGVQDGSHPGILAVIKH